MIDEKIFHHYMMMRRSLEVDRLQKQKWWYGDDGVG